MSDKNLLCIVLTFGLAFFTIGNAFHSGNYMLGVETILIWAIVYTVMPLVLVIDKKTDYAAAPSDIKVLLYKTVQNCYLFVSFCIALLLSILFDDLVDYTGHFVEDAAAMDMVVIPLLVAFSTTFSLLFYYLVSKARIEKLKTRGEKVDVLVEDVKTINNRFYVKGNAINPVTGERIKLIGVTYAESKDDIPKWLHVYFDTKNPLEYYFDTCFWLKETE